MNETCHPTWWSWPPNSRVGNATHTACNTSAHGASPHALHANRPSGALVHAPLGSIAALIWSPMKTMETEPTFLSLPGAAAAHVQATALLPPGPATSQQNAVVTSMPSAPARPGASKGARREQVTVRDELRGTVRYDRNLCCGGIDSTMLSSRRIAWFGVATVGAISVAVNGLDNGLGLTPPMGFNPWSVRPIPPTQFVCTLPPCIPAPSAALWRRVLNTRLSMER